jgi:hypothetical protein
MSQEINSNYIEERIQDWENRIKDLFKLIESWLMNNNKYSMEIKHIIQRNEELMKRFNVLPKKLPVLVINTGKDSLKFIPSALWIIGGNGRIDILGKWENYLLIDMTEPNSTESNWNFTSPSKIEIRKFNKTNFHLILRDNFENS